METLEFQAEARQLLQLVIHSVYSSADLFLRELISNASDALDKLRLEAYRHKDLVADVSDLHVEIQPDPAGRTLTVRDNGIGMTRDEVVAMIGTIARSGTSEFARRLDQTGDPSAVADLYRRVSGDPWGRPLLTVPLSLEGRLEFRAILYVPSRAPYDPYAAAAHRGPQLYVRNVLVDEDVPDLLPEFLRFVRDVVDADLPLTVSRESLQSDARIEVMRRQLTRKVLAALDDLSSSAPLRDVLGPVRRGA